MAEYPSGLFAIARWDEVSDTPYHMLEFNGMIASGFFDEPNQMTWNVGVIEQFISGM